MARRPANGSAFSDEQLQLLAAAVNSDVAESTNERIQELVQRHFDEGLRVHSSFVPALCHVFAMGMQFALNQRRPRKRRAKGASDAGDARDPD